MLACSGLSVPLGQAEVDDIDIVLLLADADQEVVGLDVSVQEVPGVYVLDSLDLR